MALARYRSPLYTGMPTPIAGTCKRSTMTPNVNRYRHNAGLEKLVRLCRQVAAFLVIQSPRKREISCKINGGRKGPVNQINVTRAFLALAIVQAGAASAADVHTQPQIDLRAEQNDNFGLVPGGGPNSNVYGYIADAIWLIDVATPRSGTTLLPRLKYQNFPDRSDLEKFEGFLDMHNQ